MLRWQLLRLVPLPCQGGGHVCLWHSCWRVRLGLTSLAAWASLGEVQCSRLLR